ncbi:phage virion morphogenesis protein [Pseudomonas sp.]|uniref:phage virion morphogenesis protein n=1 Tax=Pseudomonas sp. TaxID=306 RepID=UPI003D11AFE5
MAGSSLSLHVRYEDRQVMRALQRLQDAAGDLTPAFKDIGEHLMISHSERFRDQVDPEGNAWQPLSPWYRARKKKNPNKILIRDVMLSATLNYQVEGESLRFGTPLIYGATHQFGDPERGIPARPFLGISDGDRTVILDILQDHLMEALQ